jgi:hypothetical protein
MNAIRSKSAQPLPDRALDLNAQLQGVENDHRVRRVLALRTYRAKPSAQHSCANGGPSYY